MTELFQEIADKAARTAEVPPVAAPSTASGDKIIGSVRLSDYDGEWETFEMTMRFISKTVKDAYARAERVSMDLCDPGDAVSVVGDRQCSVNVKRIASESSGYIMRTGHFYVIAKFRIKRRRTAPPNEYIGTADQEVM